MILLGAGANANAAAFAMHAARKRIGALFLRDCFLIFVIVITSCFVELPDMYY